MCTGKPQLPWKQKEGYVDELCEVVEEFVRIKRIGIPFTDGEAEFLRDKILNMLPL